MFSFKKPLSQDQKRLKVRDATRLLIEGEDFDYIRATISEVHRSTFTKIELESLASQVALLSVDALQALFTDLNPCRRDNRHFQVAQDARAAQELQKSKDFQDARAADARAADARAADARAKAAYEKGGIWSNFFLLIFIVSVVLMILEIWSKVGDGP